jgi:hypothetical protein
MMELTWKLAPMPDIARPVMITASDGSGTAKTCHMMSVSPPAVSTTSLMIVHESRKPLSHRFTPTFPADPVPQESDAGLLPGDENPVRSVTSILLIAPRMISSGKGGGG